LVSSFFFLVVVLVMFCTTSTLIQNDMHLCVFKKNRQVTAIITKPVQTNEM
jgi:hypothetical protein